MAKGIRLSKEHGVNPSLLMCFYCGKEKGIAMLGKLKGDVKAPERMLTDYEPCSECAEKFKQGILWIEVIDTPMATGQLEIAKDVWPTGRWLVTTDKLLDIINDKRIADDIRAKRKALVGRDIFEALRKKGGSVHDAT